MFAGADPATVSERALLRGRGQLGSLGAGNHFLEVQYVDTDFDETTATAFGLSPDQVCVLIHSGSRGLGHQVCSDHVRTMQSAMTKHGITVPDRQLACVPVESEEGRRYLGAMAAAANYGRANRQLLCDATRRAFHRAVGAVALRLLYDVSHNLAQLEWHEVDCDRRLLCVHRKGATRALPPNHAELPDDLRQWGQPVLVPGSMGTASYVLAGVAGSRAFHSACHGAGRTMSRAESKRRTSGRALVQHLEREGVLIRAGSNSALAEEAPLSYKDVDEVVLACETAGLARRVARLRPLGVLKG
jgi:tRNA-splicing ligase RtcB